jgi:glycine/D-amino acid oxidase-like deaminating enzyme/nitrite reductase/ring-hydroxylating ferredoxin subunit
MGTKRKQTASAWMANPEMPRPGALTRDLTADVCIVGAGIAGMTTAYLLARRGKSVVVVDAGQIGSGQTQRTTAHLSNAVDDRYYEIERLHGKEGTRIVADSHSVAIDEIERIVGQEAIDCDFERLDGFLFVPPGEAVETLEEELAAAHRAGLKDVELVERAPLESFDTGPCLRFPRQGQFHPLKYLAALSRSIQQEGSSIFAKTRVDRIEGGSTARIETHMGPVITAAAVVVATNTPINDRVAIHTKQAPYLTYAIGCSVPAGVIPKALYWDTGVPSQERPAPYHYIRLAPADDGHTELLIVGGEDHKTGQADDSTERHARLETWARQHFPMLGEIKFRWSGQVVEPVDGVAFIGRNPLDADNVFIATGDSGMGMTHGTIAGLLLTDLILGRQNPWAALYDPSRVTVLAADQFAKENLNVAKQYTSWLTGGDVSDVEEIEPGTGAVVRRGLSKVAVYRDSRGGLHERSAVCPHLGCIVAWNGAEKSWDCPCHGSRFDPHGRLLNGPAISDLALVESRKQK